MKSKIKKIIKYLAIVLIMAVSIFCMCTMLDEKPTFADSGFSTSHSSSHSSHSSSHSSSSSSRSRSSSSSSRSRSSSSSSGSGSSSISGKASAAIGFFVFFVMMAIIVVPIIIGIASSNSKPPVIKRNYLDNKQAEDTIKKYIPSFNIQEFIQNSFNTYKKIQEAWMNFNLDEVKHLMPDEMYNMYQSQLDTLEVKGERNVMKDMILRESHIMKVDVQNNVITVTVAYTVDQYDYIADINTGKLIRGEDKKKMRVDYIMKFRKNLNDEAKLTHCPNCGAELKDYNGSGVCEFCGSKLVSDNTEWVLTEKQAVNQKYI